MPPLRAPALPERMRARPAPGFVREPLDPAAVRSETGALGDRCFLNSARVSLMPARTAAALHSAIAKEYHTGWAEGRQELVLESTREALASLVNASPAEIVMTQSASYGINLLVNGLAWRAGDSVVVTDLTYRSVAQSLFRVRDVHGVELRIVRSSEELRVDPSQVLASVDTTTRLVVVPMLPVFCGVPQAVAEIGALLAETPTLFVVNATQALGQMPIDVRALRCDFLFATSRKWLRGPRGLGFLFVERSRISQIRPTYLGYPAGVWTDLASYELAPGIDRLYLGDYPYALLSGLIEAIRYARELGLHQIEARNRLLGLICREALSELGHVELYDREGGMTGTVPFNVKGIDASEVVRRLAAQGIVTCTLEENNALLAFRRLRQRALVRASIHYFNNEEDVSRFVGALEAFG